MSRSLLFLSLFSAACGAITPEEGDWSFFDIRWSGSTCSDDLLGLVSITEEVVSLREDEEGLVLSTWMEDVRCERVGPRSFDCEPVVLVEVGPPEVPVSMMWTATRHIDLWNPTQAGVELRVEGTCLGAICDELLAVADDYGSDVGCEAWGTQDAWM